MRASCETEWLNEGIPVWLAHRHFYAAKFLGARKLQEDSMVHTSSISVSAHV